MVTPAAKREAVTHLCEAHEVSQRRACDVLNVDRSTVRYSSVRPDDADLRNVIRGVAQARRRFGYRRIGVMLERQGIYMNYKKLLRLYRDEKLQVRKRGGRKRALGTRRPMVLPSGINERWSLDFVSDAFTDGRKPKTIVSDNGTEFTSMAILKWCQETKIGWHYIAPGKPMQNAFVESLPSNHTLEGGLQCNQTPLIIGQSHAT
jgi:putative transposase